MQPEARARTAKHGEEKKDVAFATCFKKSVYKGPPGEYNKFNETRQASRHVSVNAQDGEYFFI